MFVGIYRGIKSFQGFLGGANWISQPSTVGISTMLKDPKMTIPVDPVSKRTGLLTMAHLAMGQNPTRVHPNPTTKLGSKMGGARPFVSCPRPPFLFFHFEAQSAGGPGTLRVWHRGRQLPDLLAMPRLTSQTLSIANNCVLQPANNEQNHKNKTNTKQHISLSMKDPELSIALGVLKPGL